MATWHVFHGQSRLIQWALQKHGCFSVDREANDIGTFRIATKILQENLEPLVLFPEGEIYHSNKGNAILESNGFTRALIDSAAN